MQQKAVRKVRRGSSWLKAGMPSEAHHATHLVANPKHQWLTEDLPLKVGLPLEALWRPSGGPAGAIFVGQGACALKKTTRCQTSVACCMLVNCVISEHPLPCSSFTAVFQRPRPARMKPDKSLQLLIYMGASLRATFFLSPRPT